MATVTSANKKEFDKKELEKRNPTKNKPSNLIPIYHGTSHETAKKIDRKGFDIKKGADNSMWFTTKPDIGEVGATGKGAIIKRYIDESKLKLGGHEEADKYFTDELIHQGYHGLKFSVDKDGTKHYRIWNPEMLDKD